MKAIICDNTSNSLIRKPVINKDAAWLWKRIDDDTLLECDCHPDICSYRDFIINEGRYGLGYPNLLFDNILKSEYAKSHPQSSIYSNFFVPGLLLV